MKKDRIAVFCYFTALEFYITNLVESLVGHGYLVEVFLKDCSGKVKEDQDSIRRIPGVRLHDFSSTEGTRIVAKATSLANALLKRFGSKSWFQSFWIRYPGVSRVLGPEPSRFLCAIGFEKHGLIWGGRNVGRYSIPLIYYSLELYDERHPLANHCIGFSRTLKLERKYHSMSCAVIVQDELRARLLAENNQTHCSEILVPISVKGPSQLARGTFFSDRFPECRGKTVVLLYGMLSRYRMLDDVLTAIGDADSSYHFIFHGFGKDASRLPKLPNLSVSLEMVSTAKIPDLISSSMIGLALYPDSSDNDRMTAFSSGKMAYYTQCGLPIVAIDYESYQNLFSEFECGVLVKTVSQIPAALEKIMKNYATYSKNSFAAFEKYFRFENQFPKILDYMKELEQRVENTLPKVTNAFPQ